MWFCNGTSYPGDGPGCTRALRPRGVPDVRSRDSGSSSTRPLAPPLAVRSARESGGMHTECCCKSAACGGSDGEVGESTDEPADAPPGASWSSPRDGM